MAEFSRHQQAIIKRYYEHFDTSAIQRLSELVSEIYLSQANKPVKLWERAKAMLSRIAADDPRVAKIVATKDVQGLARLVNELSAGMKQKQAEQMSRPHEAAPVEDATSGTAASQGSDSDLAPPSSNDPLSSENLKRAMKAFRKRLKLTRLDDESKLGRSGNPMSGGRQSQVAAIMAPREFPKTVWDELVRQGKLRSADGVFYEVAGE